MEYPLVTATVETLPNGLALILDPDPTAPVVSAQYWVETGSVHEGNRLGAGLSHFLEHMVFKGTRNYDGETLANAVPEAGGHWNAYTTYERTVYYIDGPSASVESFLKILTELVFLPTLPESEFEKEKDVIRREIDMGLDDPDHTSHQLLVSTAYVQDPRKHPVIGHRHLFDEITHEDLVAYHRSRYTPERAFLVVSGDFDAVKIRELVVSLMREIPYGGGPEPLVPVDPPQTGERRARTTFAIPASRVTMAWKIPPSDHLDAPAYDVLSALLGRGRSAILYRRLRQEQELALEISAWSWHGPDREGLFAVSAEALPEKRDAMIAAVLAELRAVSGAALEDDLRKAQRQIAASQFRTLTTVSGRATDLASNWHESRDLNHTRHYLARIQAVTVADVRRVVQELTEQRMTLTVVDPEGAEPPKRESRSLVRRLEVETLTLSNGVQVALLPDRRVPLLHFQAAVRSGLPSETSTDCGLNQLLASTLPQGTKSRTAEELAMELESLGASIGASTGNNALLVQSAGLAPDFSTLGRVLAEVLQAPIFPDEAIAREKASQLAAWEEASEDPLHTGLRELRRSVFSGKGYGLDPLGSRESLEALNRLSLVAHHRRHFNGSNVCLAVAGDFDSAAAADLMENWFGSLPSGPVWSPPDSTCSLGADLTFHLPKNQAVLAIGFPGAHALDENRHALAMLQEYCSDMAGPLFTRIREELGLAYRVGATQFLGFDTGLFTFYLATSPEQVAIAREEILKEIAKIAQQGIPAGAFERVRATVLSGLAIQQQSLASCARLAAVDLLFGQPADQHRSLARVYEHLSMDSVAEAASKVFSVPPTLVTVLPE